MTIISVFFLVLDLELKFLVKLNTHELDECCAKELVTRLPLRFCCNPTSVKLGSHVIKARLVAQNSGSSHPGIEATGSGFSWSVPFLASL